MKRNKYILCRHTHTPLPPTTDVNTQSTVGHHESICLQSDRYHTKANGGEKTDNNKTTAAVSPAEH